MSLQKKLVQRNKTCSEEQNLFRGTKTFFRLEKLVQRNLFIETDRNNQKHESSKETCSEEQNLFRGTKPSFVYDTVHPNEVI